MGAGTLMPLISMITLDEEMTLVQMENMATILWLSGEDFLIKTAKCIQGKARLYAMFGKMSGDYSYNKGHRTLIQKVCQDTLNITFVNGTENIEVQLHFMNWIPFFKVSCFGYFCNEIFDFVDVTNMTVIEEEFKP